MVKIKTVFQLHEYKNNIKFCRWTISKSVAELSSILSVKCRQKPSLIKKKKKKKTPAHTYCKLCHKATVTFYHANEDCYKVAAK